jgi:hypothetical protein
MAHSHGTPVAQANFMLVGALVMGMVLAVFLGTVIGNSEVKPLLYIGSGVMAILFAVSLHRYVWQIALFLLYLGFSFRPTSFSFGAVELACGLGVSVMALFIWQRKAFQRPAILESSAFRFAERALFVWLLYVALHFVFNVKVPHRPAEFVMGNAVKSYFALTAPLLLLFYFGRSPAGITARGDFFWTIARIALLGILLNVGIRFYELAGGMLFIPVLNGSPSVYALRGLAPLAMLMGTVGLTDPSRVRLSFSRRVVFLMLVSFGTIGAVFSGGRATLVFGFGMILGVLFFRRKIVALSAVAMVGVVGFAVANLSADWVNTKANPYVQRSLQWVLLEKNWETVRSLESSTDWRRELARRAIAEWRSEPRIFWTGRATYGFGAADETALLISGGFEALIQTSLRRGATHNLLTDLLVTYGLIGCLLYLTVYVALIRFAWKVYRTRGLSPPAVNLALVCLIGSLLGLFYGLVGGGSYPADQIWFLIVLIGAFYSGKGLEKPSQLPSAAEGLAGKPSAVNADRWARPDGPQRQRFRRVVRT